MADRFIYSNPIAADTIKNIRNPFIMLEGDTECCIADTTAYLATRTESSGPPGIPTMSGSYWQLTGLILTMTAK